MQFPVIHLDETDSTNNYLKNLFLSKKKIEELTTVYSKFQTSGKGQRGNSWESEKDKNLLASVVLYPDMLMANEQFIVSQIISLAIKDSLDNITKDVTIKWPNDIYWKQKKICGILIENLIVEDKIGQSIMGFGLNVNQTDFTSDAPNPVSLKQITGKDYIIEKLLEEIIENLNSYYSDIKRGVTDYIIKKYKTSLFRAEGYYLYNDGINDFKACIKDVLPNGVLVLEKKDGEVKHFAFKEIKYIL